MNRRVVAAVVAVMLAIVGLTLAVSTPAQANSNTVVSADTTVAQTSAGTNYGTATTLWANGNGVDHRYSYFKVTAPAVPAGETLTSWTLNVNVTSPVPSTVLTLDVVSNSWTETGMTYTTGQPAVLTSGISTTTLGSRPSTVSFNIGKSWVTPGATVSFRIRSSLSGNTAMASRETATPPTLTMVTAVTPKAVYGANFGSGPDESRYPAVVPVARLFPGNGYPDNITTSSAYQEAKARGAKAIILDFKNSTGVVDSAAQANASAVVSSAVADGMTVLAGWWHEPEHNSALTPQQWVDGNVALAPTIRAAGGQVAPILQTGTVLGIQGRVLSDYNLPAGTADLCGFDYYPGNFTTPQDQVLPQEKAACQSVFGTTRWLIGEYGVETTDPNGPALINAFQAYFDANGGAYASYWSQSTDVFTDATAAAWWSD